MDGMVTTALFHLCSYNVHGHIVLVLLVAHFLDMPNRWQKAYLENLLVNLNMHMCHYIMISCTSPFPFKRNARINR